MRSWFPKAFLPLFPRLDIAGTARPITGIAFDVGNNYVSTLAKCTR